MLRAMLMTMRNSLRKPVTELYPTKKFAPPERYRGRHIFYDELCIGCSLCAKVCPNDTIVMLERPEQTDPKLKHRPIIDLSRCIFCGYCAEVCPAKCLFMGHAYEMAGTSKAELVFTYKGMIESPAAVDNNRAIYSAVEGENMLRIENEQHKAALATRAASLSSARSSSPASPPTSSVLPASSASPVLRPPSAMPTSPPDMSELESSTGVELEVRR